MVALLPAALSVPTRAPILITSINYPPEHSGIGPYVGEIAEHLAALGHEVQVVTGVPHYPAWSTPDRYRRRLRCDEWINGVRITRIRHVIPHRQTALRRGAYEASFLLNAGRVRLERAPRIVLSVSPSLAGALVGQRIAREHQVPLALIVQDLMGAAARQSGIANGGRVAGFTERLEGGLIRAADRVAIPHESFRARVEELGAPPERVSVIPNWTHIGQARDAREEVRRRLGWTDRYVCLHAGNMGLKQGLDVVVDAAREAVHTDPEMLFVLLGDGSQRSHLQQAAAELSNVVFLDPVADDEFPDVLAAADTLLLTQRASVLDMSLPSKLTSYFSAGRPVIASVATEGGSAGEVRRARGGLVVPPEDPQALLAAVRSLHEEPVRSAAYGESGQAYARDHLGRDASLARIAELLDVGAPTLAPVPVG